MKEPRRKQIVIAESEHGLPFSKGLTASSLMMTGLGPARSYQVANKIEQEMVAGGLEQVSQEQLVDITLKVLRREAGDQYAEAFIKWQSVAELDVPLIILIGGATGVGKSTVATQLASRLGITRVVSTDAVREILRSAFTPEMFPTLYSSSFEADKAVRQPIPHSGDKLIIGFREQAAAVAVGAQALIGRAIAEGTDLILEGAHLVPGFIESLDEIDHDRAVVVSLLISVDDEKLHRSHFFRRNTDTKHRSEQRYLANFKKIRRIQKYMVTSAMMRGVPIISHYDLDRTLSETISHVVAQALKTVEVGKAAADAEADDEGLLNRAVGVIDREREGSGSHEAVS
jgi:2-phosphoglycerate kinase